MLYLLALLFLLNYLLPYAICGLYRKILVIGTDPHIIQHLRDHAKELIISGIAQKALARRLDITWFNFNDIDRRHPAAPEGLPVAMADASNTDSYYLYDA